MKVVLDTSAYSQLQRGHVGVARKLAEADLVLVPWFVVGELEAGFQHGDRLTTNRRQLASLLDRPEVVVPPVTAGTTSEYGALMAALRRAGTPIPTNDVWIAATAIEHGASVITLDSDFERAPGVVVELLAVDH